MDVMTVGALLVAGGGKSELAATISSVVQERLCFNLSPETEARAKRARLVSGPAPTNKGRLITHRLNATGADWGGWLVGWLGMGEVGE